MNGIVDVRKNVPFKMLLGNYGNKRCRIPKNQTVAHFLPKQSELTTTTVNLVEVLGLRDHSYYDRYREEAQEVFNTVNKEDYKGPPNTNGFM